MPRVKSCDKLYQRATDKVLPHLPQLDNEGKIFPSTEAKKSEGDVHTPSPITNCSTSSGMDQHIPTQQPQSMITASEAAWQDHLLKDQRARKWKLSTSLQIVLDQNTTLLSDINLSSAKAECLVSLLNDMAGANQRLRYLHQRAIDQSHTLNQQTEQLANASKFVIKSNATLITECSNFLSSNKDSYDSLIAAKETSFLHATSTAPYPSAPLVSRNRDLIDETAILAIFITSLTTLLDALENINVLLLKHKQVLEGQIVEFKTTMAELVQKKGGSGLSLLFKLSCFR